MRDREFLRGDVPMTKEEVRAIVLDKLELKSSDALMDIGAGTGSVSIDAAKKLDKGWVLAIEQKEAAIALIHTNIQKHGVQNIKVRQGKAPQGMDDIDHFNKFFIGGSGGNLTEILNLIKNKAPKDSIIVVTAILLDTMNTAYEFFKTNKYDFELIQVGVNKVDTSRRVAMLLAHNPIFILTAKRNDDAK